MQKAIADTLMSTDTLNGVVVCSLECVYQLLKMVRCTRRVVWLAGYGVLVWLVELF